jgi:hypothetical protein
MWLASPDYGQRAAADVICLTYHDLFFNWVMEAGRSSCESGHCTSGQLPEIPSLDMLLLEASTDPEAKVQVL